MGIATLLRFAAPWLATAAVCAAIGGGLLHDRSRAREHAREEAAADLAALERCLEGEPLGPGETLGGRMRGVELSVTLARMALDEAKLGDAGASDAGAIPESDAGAASQGTTWPMRCAPFAEALGRKLDETGDPSVEALREALPTAARFALPYALLPDEAAELAAGIEKAKLPARKADNEPAPPAIAAPLSAAGVLPLGKGRIELGPEMPRNRSSDLLATSTMHLLVRDARVRACALDVEGAAGPYGIARCGELPAWINAPRAAMPVLDDGAPFAVYVTKDVPQTPDWRTSVRGILVLAPGGKKAIPINKENYGWREGDAYVAGDGSYIIPAYSPLVRLGTIAALTSDDLDGPVNDRTVMGTPPTIRGPVAAYGIVFFNDQPPIYKDFDPARRFWARRIDPTLDPAATDLGPATANDLTALGGCRAGKLAAMLFATYERHKARVVLIEEGAPLRAIDAEVGSSKPHVACGRDGVVVTSVESAAAYGSVVVIETRCAGTSCTSKRSAPVALPAAADVDAVTYDGGVVLAWVTRADHVTTTARGMAFYKVAAVEALPAAPPRPLFEGARRAGIEVSHAYVVPRPKAVVVALETRGKEPSIYAARIDASGAATAVRVEETSW